MKPTGTYHLTMSSIEYPIIWLTTSNTIRVVQKLMQIQLFTCRLGVDLDIPIKLEHYMNRLNFITFFNK